MDKIKEINENIEMEKWAENRIQKNKKLFQDLEDDSINEVVVFDKERTINISKMLKGGGKQ